MSGGTVKCVYETNDLSPVAPGIYAVNGYVCP
jgi:hypothetical protein